jgi:hypothetical protein
VSQSYSSFGWLNDSDLMGYATGMTDFKISEVTGQTCSATATYIDCLSSVSWFTYMQEENHGGMPYNHQPVGTRWVNDSWVNGTLLW